MAKSPANRQSYRYTGPVTPLDIEGRDTRMLFPGTSYQDLPADNEIVSNLIERELLVAETSASAAPIAPAANEGE